MFKKSCISKIFKNIKKCLLLLIGVAIPFCKYTKKQRDGNIWKFAMKKIKLKTVCKLKIPLSWITVT